MAACYCCSLASTAIEVTKLWQEIAPVDSKPSASGPKVVHELCCCFFTLALSARWSPLVACYCCSHASTAIEVTKLLQKVTPVDSKPSASGPKVVHELCCCFFTLALSARFSLFGCMLPLATACTTCQHTQIVICFHRLQNAQNTRAMFTLPTAASTPRMQCFPRLCTVGRCCLWQAGGGDGCV